MIVPSEMFDKLQQEWAPLDDAVFQLTPPTFHAQANCHYTTLGCPSVSKGTFWEVYAVLLNCFRASSVDPTLQDAFCLANLGADDEMELIDGFQELRDLDGIIGDVAITGDYAAEFTDSGGSNEDTGMGDEVYGDFTDSGDE